ncbi:hypothetical protein EPN90_03570 [Patescibacteria group bacterium]|nr:MAG: hypothetical protein EPN90_03570 [Patescibacteria group bacterium]
MNPKQFFQIGGIVLVLVGLLGFIGVLGPTEGQSVFGPLWWFDNAENWAHLVVGIVALIVGFALAANLQKPLAIVVGVVGILVGLWSLLVSTKLLGANLENPMDTILHLVVGAWALWAGLRGAKAMPPAAPPKPMGTM